MAIWKKAGSCYGIHQHHVYGYTIVVEIDTCVVIRALIHVINPTKHREASSEWRNQRCIVIQAKSLVPNTRHFKRHRHTVTARKMTILKFVIVLISVQSVFSQYQHNNDNQCAHIVSKHWFLSPFKYDVLCKLTYYTNTLALFDFVTDHTVKVQHTKWSRIN
jgi:hypothetical protein